MPKTSDNYGVCGEAVSSVECEKGSPAINLTATVTRDALDFNATYG